MALLWPALLVLHGCSHACMQACKPPQPLMRCLLPAACSCGGIVLVSADGRINCNNTLDDRMHVSYQSNLPNVRTKLFGELVRGQH